MMAIGTPTKKGRIMMTWPSDAFFLGLGAAFAALFFALGVFVGWMIF